MGTKSVIILVAVCIAVVVLSVAIIGLFAYNGLIEYEKTHPIMAPQATPYPSNLGQITKLPTQILQPSNTEVGNKPYIAFKNLTVLDDRSRLPYNLHVSCWLNNTGGGTAYNAYLHLTAFTQEGTVIDKFYSFGGMTPHVGLGLDFRLDYAGTQIKSCTIAPIYTDSLGTVSNATLP